MDDRALLKYLEELVDRLGILIRHERFESENDFSAGGLCRIKGRQVLILNRGASMHEKVRALRRALVKFDLGGLYIKPALRDFLESEERDPY